jgi:uncharacterized coiled-coil protein SlyX
MRLFAIFLGFGLFAGVVAEGAYIIKQQRQLAGLTEKLNAIQENAAEAERERDGTWRADPSRPSVREDERLNNPNLPPDFLPALEALGDAVNEAGGLGAIVASQEGDLPLPPVLASAEAREQLRNFINAQMGAQQKVREEERQKRSAERVNEVREELTAKLALAPADAEKFNGLISATQEKRRELFDAIREGKIDRDQLRDQMREMYQKSGDDMRKLLGEQKFGQFEELRTQMGWGRGGWGNNSGRGGPPGAAPGAMPGAVPPAPQRN